MILSDTKNIGYVYILEVKDIDLPVCKIGRTKRNPYDRCTEINRSSTGDFLWQVAYEFAVDDCEQFEKSVHKKLNPLRQKNREFFNITADVAFDAVRSILDSQSEINELSREAVGERLEETLESRKSKKSRNIQFGHRESGYAEILAIFAAMIGCKGRPFGQLNKPYFGMSDGNEGVQWNIAIYTETDDIRLGVNLEGLKPANWPIATLLLNELADPRFFEARDHLTNTDSVILRFTRDAWQAASRPSIAEKFIGPGDVSIKDIDSVLWESMLAEALDCLSEEKSYRGRATQVVTLASQPKHGDQSRIMEVSPHLTVWTPIEALDDMGSSLKMGKNRLTPIYDWVSSASQ